MKVTYKSLSNQLYKYKLSDCDRRRIEPELICCRKDMCIQIDCSRIPSSSKNLSSHRRESTTNKWETRYSLNMAELDKVISPSRRHAIGASQTNKSHLSGPDKSITLPVKSLHCCPEFPFYTQCTCQDKHLNVIFCFSFCITCSWYFFLRYVSWSNHTFRIIERFLVGYIKQQNCACLSSVCLDWMHYYDFLGI